MDKGAHDKNFGIKATTKDAEMKAYQEVVEKLSDEKSISCPLCHTAWSVIADQLSLEAKDPTVRVRHMRTTHMNVWNLLNGLFEVPEKKLIPSEQVTWTSNPESCSENPEELSKEELAEAISSSPELRTQFYRKWIKKLQDRY